MPEIRKKAREGPTRPGAAMLCRLGNRRNSRFGNLRCEILPTSIVIAGPDVKPKIWSPVRGSIIRRRSIIRIAVHRRAIGCFHFARPIHIKIDLLRNMVLGSKVMTCSEIPRLGKLVRSQWQRLDQIEGGAEIVKG